MGSCVIAAVAILSNWGKTIRRFVFWASERRRPHASHLNGWKVVDNIAICCCLIRAGPSTKELSRMSGASVSDESCCRSDVCRWCVLCWKVDTNYCHCVFIFLNFWERERTKEKLFLVIEQRVNSGRLSCVLLCDMRGVRPFNSHFIHASVFGHCSVKLH